MGNNSNSLGRIDITRSLRVLVVDEELPFPLNSGKRIRTFNLLKHLATRHRITFLCHRNTQPEELSLACETFKQLGIDVELLTQPLPQQTLRTPKLKLATQLAKNLISPLPYLVQKNVGPELRNRVANHVSSGRFDLVHFEWTPYFASLMNASPIPVIVSAHNVESLIWKRYIENEKSRVKRWYIQEQERKLRAFECAAFSSSATTVFVSQPDAELAHKEFSANRSAVVENGVDFEYFSPTFCERNSFRLLMLGSLDWRPNIDGIQQFIEHILPNLRKRDSRFELQIVGRNPDEQWLRRVRTVPGVSVFPNVPDVRPILDNAGLLVVPLRIGGGSRLKILEAVASGLPVVSTRIGAEGLDFEPMKHYFASESIDQLEQPIVQAVESTDRNRRFAESAYKLARSKYDWRVLADKLDHVWLESTFHLDRNKKGPSPSFISGNGTTV